MRKAYKKARWKRMASRVEKRGGMIIFRIKTIKDVSIQDFPFTYEGMRNAIEYLKQKDT